MEHFIFEERGLANTHKKKVMQSFSDQKKNKVQAKKKTLLNPLPPQK